MAAYSEQEIASSSASSNSNGITTSDDFDEINPRYDGWYNENNPWGQLMMDIEQGGIPEEAVQLIEKIKHSEPGIDYYHPSYGTLLSMAMIYGLYEVAEMLLQAGANPNLSAYDPRLDNRRVGLLYWAIINLDPQAVELLIKYHVDIEKPVAIEKTFSNKPLKNWDGRLYKVLLNPPRNRKGKYVITPLVLAINAEWARLNFGYDIPEHESSRIARLKMICVLIYAGARLDYYPENIRQELQNICDFKHEYFPVEDIFGKEYEMPVFVGRLTDAIAV